MAPAERKASQHPCQAGGGRCRFAAACRGRHRDDGTRPHELNALLEPGGTDAIVELDDDGLLIADDVFARLQRLYAAGPSLGIVSFRIADEQGETLRRHVPRLGAGDPLRRGPVTLFLGGGHALSGPMPRPLGGRAAFFFLEHEESDLAWRALDAGWDIWYEPDLVLQHPGTPPDRHAVHYRLTARNRVWLGGPGPAPRAGGRGPGGGVGG